MNFRQRLRALTSKIRAHCGQYPDGSWFWPVLEEYRDHQGRTLEEVELANVGGYFLTEEERNHAIATHRWRLSPKRDSNVDHLITLLEAFFEPNDRFTCLEFGTCFGTTLSRVLAHFRDARAIGLESNPARHEVTQWLVERMDSEWNLKDRVVLHRAALLDAPLEECSIDAVFMDTSHMYPGDFECIMHLVNGSFLRRGFVFVGDDPMHSGTKLSRERFMSEHNDLYRIITRVDKDLWWFFKR